MIASACAVVVASLAGCGQQKEQADNQSPSVELEAVSTPLPNSFSQSIGSDAEGVQSIADDSGTVSSNSEGLYATKADAPPCDREALISRLTGDPGEASAWAGARGIRPDEIPEHVRQLTPANLRSDTYVTDYRYENGRAAAHPAVLQAGTAVLLDDVGAPVTRCATGNPLGQPMRYERQPSFSGHDWPGFRAAAVWIIEPVKVPIDRFVMDNVDRQRGRDNDRDVVYLEVDRGKVYTVRPLPGHQVPPLAVAPNRPWPKSADQTPDQRTDQTGQRSQPAPGNQPAQRNQPGPAGQNGQPAPGDRPAPGNQPQGTQPGQGAQNGRTSQGTQPAPNDQPAQGAQPGQRKQPGPGQMTPGQPTGIPPTTQPPSK